MTGYASTLRGAIAIAAIAVLAGCTAQDDGPAVDAGSTPAPAATAAPSDDADQEPAETPEPAPDPNDVPPDTTDYSEDEGSAPDEYEYEPEPEPAESVVATLCNLNQVYFTGLRAEQSGVAVVDDTLRSGLVGLFDQLDYWSALRDEYPESADDIDTGLEIYEEWDHALLSHDNGDDGAAAESMAAAEDLIATLPAENAANCASS